MADNARAGDIDTWDDPNAALLDGIELMESTVSEPTFEPLIGMCPHCGEMVRLPRGALTEDHQYEGEACPGSQQNARNPESDARPLWNGEPNRKFRG